MPLPAAHKSRYSANITAGALRLRESRVIAGLLLEGCDAARWQTVIAHENRLLLPNSSSAIRLARLLRQRLETMEAPAWEMIQSGPASDATQLLFAAALKHSALMLDFLTQTVHDHYRLRAPALPKTAWNAFVEGCAARDPEVLAWSPLTLEKARQVVYTCLAEAGYLNNTREMLMQTVRITRPVQFRLREQGDDAILAALEIQP